ncbi:MAG: hypothetical protein DHS20C16_10130 [Phycisphaerae bacterium]|nr:MAG: hypothetical protein DHS20C16_10130 [Phycisphaerae bacterium]
MIAFLFERADGSTMGVHRAHPIDDGAEQPLATVGGKSGATAWAKRFDGLYQTVEGGAAYFVV